MEVLPVVRQLSKCFMDPELYVTNLYERFRSRASAEDAFFMAKYMKNQFPFFGLKKPMRQEIEKDWFRHSGFPSLLDMPQVVHLLWELPERECQYAAMDIMEKFRKEFTGQHLELFEYCIVTKPWWDTTDLIAARFIGTMFRNDVSLIRPCVQRWLEDENIWLRRTCLLFQLKYRKATDRELLEETIRRLSGEKEFFIRKAIGWALREYSKTDAHWVLEFVQNNPLSPLSRREALKILKRKNDENSGNQRLPI